MDERWRKQPPYDKIDLPRYQTSGFRPHFELLEMIGGVNFEAGREVFGSRGYFLTGPAVLLNQALINYGLAFLMKDGRMMGVFVPSCSCSHDGMSSCSSEERN